MKSEGLNDEGSDPPPDGRMQSVAIKEDAGPSVEIQQADRETDTTQPKTLEIHQQTPEESTDVTPSKPTCVEVANGRESNIDRPHAQGPSNEPGVQKPAADDDTTESPSFIEEALKGKVASIPAAPNQGEDPNATVLENPIEVSGEPESGQVPRPATLSDERLKEQASSLGKSKPDRDSSVANNTPKDGTDDDKPARNPEDLNFKTEETADDTGKINVEDTASKIVEVDRSQAGSPKTSLPRLDEGDLQVDASTDPPPRPPKEDAQEVSDPVSRAGSRSTSRPASPRKRHKIELADGNEVTNEIDDTKKPASDVYSFLRNAPFDVAGSQRKGYGGRPRCMALDCKKMISVEGKEVGLCSKHLSVVKPPAKFEVDDVVYVKGKQGKGNKGGIARVARLVARLVDGGLHFTYDVKFYRDGDERLAVPEEIIELHDVDEAQLDEDVKEEQKRKQLPITGVIPPSRASKSKAKGKKPAREQEVSPDEPDKLSAEEATESESKSKQDDKSQFDPVLSKRGRRLKSMAKAKEPAREHEVPGGEPDGLSSEKTAMPESKSKPDDESAERDVLQFDFVVPISKNGRRLCKVKGCNKYSQSSATGMCNRHYTLFKATKKDPESMEASITSEPLPKITKQSRGRSTNPKAKKRKLGEVAVSAPTPSSKRSRRGQGQQAERKSQERECKEDGIHLSTVPSRHSKRIHKAQPKYEEPASEEEDDESVEIISTTPSPKRRKRRASEEQTSTEKPPDSAKYACPFPGCDKTNLTKMGIRAHHGAVHPGVKIDWANIKPCGEDDDVCPPVPPPKRKAKPVRSPFSSDIVAPSSGGTRRSRRTPTATDRYGVGNNNHNAVDDGDNDGGDDNEDAGGDDNDGNSGDDKPEGEKEADEDDQSVAGEDKDAKPRRISVLNDWSQAVRFGRKYLS